MIVFFIVWLIWFLSEILLNRLLRANKSDKQGVDKGSIRIIWITIGIANTLAILSAIFLKFPICHKLWVPVLGLTLIILGMIIRFFAIYSLGGYFTVDVTIRENHKIKQDGIYKLIRHPSYSGSLLSFIGFGLSLNNWFSLVIVTILITGVMIYRISIEEKVLIDQFGQAYIDYKSHSFRLIPWIY
jgi:protein-S-isoprenylcysteine O-methyltransferase Ste14